MVEDFTWFVNLYKNTYLEAPEKWVFYLFLDTVYTPPTDSDCRSQPLDQTNGGNACSLTSIRKSKSISIEYLIAFYRTLLSGTEKDKLFVHLETFCTKVLDLKFHFLKKLFARWVMSKKIVNRSLGILAMRYNLLTFLHNFHLTLSLTKINHKKHMFLVWAPRSQI